MTAETPPFEMVKNLMSFRQPITKLPPTHEITMGNYPYLHLNLPTETRLLTLYPGDFDDPLTGTITHLSLLDPEPYEALSYCWGMSQVHKSPGLNDEVVCAVYDPTGEHTESGHRKFQELANHPHYQQLYYQTGGPRPPGYITCDGVELTVGGELYAALSRLRKTDEPLRIWVDALCINQSDIAERNKHVRMMQEIYAQASMVRVWLGEEVGIEFGAVEVLNVVCEVFNKLFKEKDRDAWDRGKLQYAFINDERMKDLHWDALGELLSRAWFERIWVIQEVVMATKAFVHAGHLAFDWTFFSSIISELRAWSVDINLRNSIGIKSVCLLDAMRVDRIKKTEQPRFSLLTLLEETRNSKSTLPCDKIYGILGLVRDSDHVDVNYDIDGAEVFRKYALSHLTRDQSPDILYHCVSSTAPPTLDLPSWVPDWTRPGQVEPFRIRQLEGNAAKGSEIKFRTDEDGRGLFIHGKLVDKIAAIDEVRPIPSSIHQRANYNDAVFKGSQHIARIEAAMSETEIWFRDAFDIAFPDKVATPETLENMWRTFMCNRTRSNKVPTDCGEGFWIFVQAILESITPDRIIREKRAAREALEDPAEASRKNQLEEAAFEEFQGGHSKWCYNRRFFRSEAGRFGWAVDGSQPGDEICIPYGGKYPLLLRPSESGSYRIIGDCYLHGVMDGEAMEPSFPEHEFHII